MALVASIQHLAPLPSTLLTSEQLRVLIQRRQANAAALIYPHSRTLGGA